MKPKPHDHQIIHSSEESDWRTPEPLVVALNEEEYGGIEIDLAADRESRKFPIWLGPGSPHDEDALAVDWCAFMRSLSLPPIGFLNPPFSRRLARAYSTGRIQIDGVWHEHPIDPVKARVYDVAVWAKKCWEESQQGFTIYGVFPFAPQTDWYRKYVYGHDIPFGAPFRQEYQWAGHAAMQERRLPHRISFLRPDGTKAQNAGVNSVIVKWSPARGIVGPWQPHTFYWSYR
jgi:hypothetical protein